MDTHNSKLAGLHSAGAIVRTTTPFDELNVYRNRFQLDDDFIARWVVPFYFVSPLQVSDRADAYRNGRSNISVGVVRKLLGNFDWRTRSVGAYWCGILNLTDFSEEIANHLLKSEVCYAGRTYALVLGMLDRQLADQTYRRYLDFYLTRPDLYFDQDDVMAAFLHLNKDRSATDVQEICRRYLAFKETKHQDPNIEETCRRFDKMIEVLTSIRDF